MDRNYETLAGFQPSFFRKEEEQTHVWNPLLLLLGVDDYR
jgi:hypothetical protein